MTYGNITIQQQDIRKVIIINDYAHVNEGAGQAAISSTIDLAWLGYFVTFFSVVLQIATP
jgi:hypothetical protein